MHEIREIVIKILQVFGLQHHEVVMEIDILGRYIRHQQTKLVYDDGIIIPVMECQFVVLNILLIVKKILIRNDENVYQIQRLDIVYRLHD